uniref:Uncharacterized protein n=1 Tax=Engystomops pustulosus TaxID=76066 RepID=A0AAV6YFH1_ENGPU|nr:hypothetical protein GDO81_026666 [Engystomops pustulosus]
MSVVRRVVDTYRPGSRTGKDDAGVVEVNCTLIGGVCAAAARSGGVGHTARVRGGPRRANDLPVDRPRAAGDRDLWRQRE